MVCQRMVSKEVSPYVLGTYYLELGTRKQELGSKRTTYCRNQAFFALRRSLVMVHFDTLCM